MHYAFFLLFCLTQYSCSTNETTVQFIAVPGPVISDSAFDSGRHTPNSYRHMGTLDRASIDFSLHNQRIISSFITRISTTFEPYVALASSLGAQNNFRFSTAIDLHRVTGLCDADSFYAP